jgi:hypothetical protein
MGKEERNENAIPMGRKSIRAGIWHPKKFMIKGDDSTELVTSVAEMPLADKNVNHHAPDERDRDGTWYSVVGHSPEPGPIRLGPRVLGIESAFQTN